MKHILRNYISFLSIHLGLRQKFYSSLYFIRPIILPKIPTYCKYVLYYSIFCIYNMLYLAPFLIHSGLLPQFLIRKETILSRLALLIQLKSLILFQRNISKVSWCDCYTDYISHSNFLFVLFKFLTPIAPDCSDNIHLMG